jgi:Rrf2 family protein
MVDTRFSVSVQIMLTLAYHDEELTNSEGLAKILKTNATFIRKLVSNLVEAKLVESFRGKGGGIKLARKAQDITLKEIYVASTDDKCLISLHKKPALKACPVSCCIHDVMNEIVEGIEFSTQNYLMKKNLGDLLRKVTA